MDDHKNTDQRKTDLKRKRVEEDNRSKLSRSEGFSWWTSLLLGVEPFASSSSCSTRKSTASELHSETGN